MNYGQILRAGFTSWPRDSKALRLLGIMLAIQIASLGLQFIASIVTGQPFEGQLSADATEATAGTLLYGLAVLVITLISTIGYAYVSIMFTLRLLQLAGFSPKGMDLGRFVRYILACIWAAIMAITSWYIKPLFAVFVILCVASVASAVLLFANPVSGGLALLLCAMGWVLYGFVILYNLLRISLLQPMVFLEQNPGIRESSKISWGMTKGRAIEAWLSWLVMLVPVTIFLVIIAGISFGFILFAAIGSSVGSLLVQAIIVVLSVAYGAIIQSMLVSVYSQFTGAKKAAPASKSSASVSRGKFSAKKTPARKRKN